MNGLSVVVVGGAVGGTSTALALARLGASVTLLERVAEPTAVGAGILLQPNGLAVLAALSLAEDLNATGRRMSGGVVRSESGRVISSVAVPERDPTFGHVLALRRSRLMDVLVSSVIAHPRIGVRFGAEVTAARPDGTVTVRSDGGLDTIRADLVVGADGVRSTVRDGGNFGSRVRSTGVTYVRGLVDGTDTGLDGEYWTWLGLFGGAPLGDGSTYFYAAADAPAVAAAVAEQDLSAFRRLWGKTLPMAEPVLARVRSFDQLLVNEVVRVDCERWSEDRLVLVGDAAHAMAPTLGQGANSAVVDAAVLSIELSGARSVETVPDCLARYTARRRPAVRRVQNQADRLAKLSHLGNKPARRTRDTVLRLAGRLPAVAERLWKTAQQEDPRHLFDALSRLRERPR
jgi:2-polyprenyl-6-methoxyphenol hydroxylase-like FAD-dependent oxidoreductase